MELKIDLTSRAEREKVLVILQALAAADPILSGSSDPIWQKGVEPVASPKSAPAPLTVAAAPLPTAPVVDILPPALSAPLVPVAVAAPVALAPLPPVALTTFASGDELDCRGLPWDDRIHSSTKSKLVNGEWKVKRGVDAAEVAAVEAELSGEYKAPTLSMPAITSVPAAALEVAAQLDPAVVFGAAPVLPAATLATSPSNFAELMQRISGASVRGVMPATALSTTCTTLGLTSVVQLSTQADMVPKVWAALTTQYPALS